MIIMEKIQITPKHLQWLAARLKIEDAENLQFDFESLLKQMPSGLFSFPSGTVIVAEGEKGDDLFVVYSGTLLVIRKQGYPVPQEIGKLCEGDFFGEIGFLMNSPRSATVKAATEVRLFKFKACDFSALMKKHKVLEDWVKSTAKNRLEKLFITNL